MSSLQDRHSRTLSNLKHQDHSPQVVIPQHDLSEVIHRPHHPHLLPPALPLILRPHIMQDHLYLSPPLPRNPTNTYYSALPFPWPKSNSDSGHCTPHMAGLAQQQAPGPLSLYLIWVFLPPTPSTQCCTAPCRAHRTALPASAVGLPSPDPHHAALHSPTQGPHMLSSVL